MLAGCRVRWSLVWSGKQVQPKCEGSVGYVWQPWCSLCCCPCCVGSVGPPIWTRHWDTYKWEKRVKAEIDYHRFGIPTYEKISMPWMLSWRALQAWVLPMLVTYCLLFCSPTLTLPWESCCCQISVQNFVTESDTNNDLFLSFCPTNSLSTSSRNNS